MPAYVTSPLFPSSNEVQSSVVPSGTLTAAGSSRLAKSSRPLAPISARLEGISPGFGEEGVEGVVRSSERPVVGLEMG